MSPIDAATFGAICRYPLETTEQTAARLNSRRADVAGSIRQLKKYKLIEAANKNGYRLTNAAKTIIQEEKQK